ncbi:alpha/beta fold hydrolase [Pseudomonas piscis]|uniref:alpha/beta fold hydrolase n=1 Tax=Pseudomonas piscis TaxID=2614538 RepID=UPI0021D60131|nr:alpha/beta fold hydrolase [Pseudomonas piscis]
MSRVYKSPAGAAAIQAQYRETLGLWPVAHSQGWIDTDLGDTFVIRSGPEDAPPVLLLHGSQSNSASWMRQVECWARTFRLYAVDLPGEAGLSAAVRPVLDSDAHARWLEQVLDGLGLARASLVGVSLGGWVALDFALRRPRRVAALALLGPSGIGRQKAFLLRAAPWLLLGRWGRRRVRDMVLGPLPRQLPPAEQALMRLIEVIDRHFLPRLARIPRFSDAQLQGLAIPLLVILGGRDVLLDSLDSQRRLQRCVPRAQVRLLADKPHYVGDQSLPVLAFLNTALEDSNGAL